MPHPDPTRIDAFELVPGHPVTEAEVYVWHGAPAWGAGGVPGTGEPRPWVVLRTDDWPMDPGAARRLAAALLEAADRVEAAAASPAAADGGS